MEPTNHSPMATSLPEKIIAITGAAFCLFLTTFLWWNVSTHQTTWPLPGLYFIEMVALSIVSAVAFVRGIAQGRIIVWGAVGIFSVFSILGALSVGFFYLPIVLIFGALAILSDVRQKGAIAVHLGIFVLAGIAQAVLMFVMVYASR